MKFTLDELRVKFSDYILTERNISQKSYDRYMSIIQRFIIYIGNNMLRFNKNEIKYFSKNDKYKSNVLNNFLNFSFDEGNYIYTRTQIEFNKYIEKFRKNIDVTEKTAKDYSNKIRLLCNITGKEKPEDFTEADLKKGLNGSFSNKNLTISAYRQFFRFYNLSTADRIKLKKVDRQNEKKSNIENSYLKPNELQILKRWFIRESKNENELVNKVAVYTGLTLGLRISEICKFKVGYINKSRLFVIGKGGRHRYIEIYKDYYKFMQNYIKQLGLTDDDYIIKNVRKKEFEPESFSNRIRKQFKELGLRNERPITFHKLRHTYATNLYNKDVPIEYIKEHLGHKRIETTMIYAKADDKNKRKYLGKNHMGIDKVF